MWLDHGTHGTQKRPKALEDDFRLDMAMNPIVQTSKPLDGMG
jgi:hypothetical protein